jgi:hypothetical protein
MAEERRKYERFEPQSVDVIVTPPSKQKYIGAVLDASCSGMAIDLVHKDHVPSPGTQIEYVPGEGGTGKEYIWGLQLSKGTGFGQTPYLGIMSV